MHKDICSIYEYFSSNIISFCKIKCSDKHERNTASKLKIETY